MEQYIKSKTKLEEYKDEGYLIPFTFNELSAIKQHLKTPDFQTDLNNDKIDEMLETYRKNPQFLLSKMILTVAIIEDLAGKHYYLMDGQHRLEMCCILNNKEHENDKMYVVFYHIYSEEQFIQLFDELNKDSYKSREYVSMSIFKKQLYVTLKDKLVEKFKDCYALKLSKTSHLYTVIEFVNRLAQYDFIDKYISDNSIDNFNHEHIYKIIKYISDKQKKFYKLAQYLEITDETIF